jgi:GNAT superfamily N-acetyltransferase
VVAIEEAAATSLAASERIEDDGWVLRADGVGVVRRANAVLPRRAGHDPIAVKLDRVAAWYRARGRPARFLLAPTAEPAGLVDALRRAGYRLGGPVLVLARPLDGGVHDGASLGLASGDVPDDGWAAAYAATLPSDERVERLRLARVAPAPKRYTAFGADGCGLAVQVGEWVGLFDVATAPHARRRGIATRVTTELLAWGAARGARRAYLQVAEGNLAARALYAGLGFEPAYRYVYAESAAADQ